MNIHTTLKAEPIKWYPHPPIGLPTRADKIALLAQADWLLLIAPLFTLPSVGLRDKVAIEAAELQELLEKSGIPNAEQLRVTFKAIQQQIQTIHLDTCSEEYNRLFECAAPCPINETGWVRRDKGTILADIAGFYRAFGLELAEAASEKVDYLVGELEFVAMLLVMLAKATEQDNAAEVTPITHNALSSFSSDHLGEWLPSFCERLSQLTVLPLYQQLAKLLQLTWTGIVAVNRLPVSDENLQEVLDEKGTPYECGMA
jgi:TorA maturation chaperone TorD